MAGLINPNSKKVSRRNVFCITLMIAFMAVGLFCATYKKIYVVGSSMRNTITGAVSEKTAGGDFVYIFDGTPQRGDIVVAAVGGKNIIKRVVALGGDYVEISGGVLYVNGAKVDEFYISAKNNTSTDSDYPLTRIDYGYMFCLGDNRDNSKDSRAIGELSTDSIVGVVADWSIKLKSITTFINTFFEFTLPDLFG